MIIETPYVYQTQLRRPRKQRTEVVYFIGRVAVDLAEYSGAEMPVAVAYANPDKWEVGKHGEMAELRWVDRRLWRRCETNESNLYAELPDAHPIGVTDPDGHRPTQTIDQDTNIAEVFRDTSTRVSERAVEKAKDFVICDGILWTETTEPVLVASGDHDRGLLVTVEPPYSHHSVDRTYRLDSLEDAIAHHANSEDVIKAPQIEVYIPEALSHNADFVALNACATELVSDMEKEISEENDAYFSDYRALRDAARAFDKDEPATIDALMQSIRKAAATCTSRRVHEENWLHGGLSNYLEQRIERALKRVEKRVSDADMQAILSM